MAERIRVFRGVTELNYNSCMITKTEDVIVYRAKTTIEANSNVETGSVISFKKNDGSTTVFSAQVVELKRPNLWELDCLTNGYELNNLFVENVYTNQSPEDIVADLISRTQNLTYASTSTSGVTLEKYIAKDYAINIIREMMEALNWSFRVDENDNVYFDPKSFINNGKVFNNGTNFQVTEWISDASEMVNRVRVIGGFENFNVTGETVVDTNTVFTLANKPTGNFSGVVSGSPVSPADYEVDAENKTVTFTSSQTDPSFDYSYDKPVIVEAQDDTSINTYGEIFKKVDAPWLNTSPDARIYAQKLVEIFSQPIVRVKGFIPVLDFDREINEIITINDTVRDETAELVLNVIKLDASGGKTILELGGRDYMLYDWNRGLNNRISKIERRFSNQDEFIFVRTLKHTLKVNLTKTTTFQYNTPGNSFVCGHPTLGLVIKDFDTEVDASLSGYDATWNGTGIGGAQYISSGYRLHCGNFNGSDNYMNGTGTVGSVQTCSFYIYTTTGTQSILQLTASANITLSSFNVATSGLTNATVYVDGVAGTLITTGTWHLVTVTFDSLSCDDIEIGREGTNYYTGRIDELMLFDNKISTANMTTIINKDFYDSSMNFTISGLLLYFAFDNPLVGDFETTKITVT
jgi:hypothetical protein